jgi:DNA-binding MarR family transcriptional regulator
VAARLEKRGLVRTAPNPRDGRGVLVALTAKGKAIVPRLLRVEVGLDDTIRRTLTRGEVTALSSYLERLAIAFSTS